MNNKKHRQWDPYEIAYDNLKDTLREVMTDSKKSPDKSWLIVPISKACSKFDKEKFLAKEEEIHPQVEEEENLKPEDTEAKEIRNIINDIVNNDKMAQSSNNMSFFSESTTPKAGRSNINVTIKPSKFSIMSTPTRSNMTPKRTIKPIQSRYITSRATTIRKTSVTKYTGLSSQSFAVTAKSSSMRKQTSTKRKKTLTIALATGDDLTNPFELKDEPNNDNEIDVLFYNI